MADDPSPLQTRAPDGYEAEFMKSSGKVLFREKSVAPWTWQLIFLLPLVLTLLSVGIPVLAGAPLAAAIPGLAIGLGSSLLVALGWLLFAVLRVTVSTDDVYVQFGLFGPRIPVSSIESVEAIDYKWTEFGGWGIKRSFKDGTTIYNMWGDHGRAVKLSYRGKDGKTERVAVGSANATQLAAAVRQAMAMQQAPAGRTRVAAGTEGAIRVGAGGAIRDAELEDADEASVEQGSGKGVRGGLD